jgi:predicted dehydrogenase
VTTVAILGHSEGNGHPFSYSSIINGYSDKGLAESGWPGIYEYVRRRHPSEFGIGGLTVTHAWTQDREVTERLCAACMIPNAVSNPEDLIGAVNAVVIARDDYSTHLPIARPFLEAGLPVFIDKPLSLDPTELCVFRPYLESGQLMSCSGMRYARELDEPRANLTSYGQVKLIRGTIVLAWEKYGVHLLEAILSITTARPLAVEMRPVEHASATVRMDDGSVLQIDALGEAPATFRVEVFGSQRTGAFDITDNFSMFRRMLWEFANSLQTGRPAIQAERTLEIMRVLIAGRISRQEGREILLHDITI